MTGGGETGKPSRHVYGPRGLSALVPMVARAAYQRRGPAASHLLADWEAVVGPHIARHSAPKKLFAGTLCIAASGPTAMELQHLSATLIARINAHLGSVAVSRLRFVQDFRAPPPRPPPPRPRPADAARVAGAVAHLPEGGLRDALRRLGATVLDSEPPGS